MSFDGQQISCDAIGNPVTYLGAALTRRGRELTSYTKGGKSIEYTYDVDGMRYNKTVKTNGVVTAEYDYVYSDGKLIAVTCTQNNRYDYKYGKCKPR